MKIVSKPIQMVSWTDESGSLHPVRFKLANEDGEGEVIKIDKIIHHDKEKLAGNEMLIFLCQSTIKGTMRNYELKYELRTCKWVLFKI